MQPETIAEQFFFVTVPIWGDDGTDSWTGTGFLMNVSVEDDRNMPIVVTNKHVMGSTDQTHVGIHVSDEAGNWKPGHGYRVRLADHDTRLAGHPDPDVDVVVGTVGGILSGTFNGYRPFFKTFSVGNLMDDEKVRDLDALEDVLFVGYPAGIFDTEHNTPVVRRGIAATPLVLDYAGQPAFLIDASVFPGSSGSPVLLWNSGSYRTRDGGLVVGSRFGVLGVLAAVHTDAVSGELVAMPADRRPVIQQPVGLGIVYRSRTILETVDALCEEIGVERGGTPPLVEDEGVND